MERPSRFLPYPILIRFHIFPHATPAQIEADVVLVAIGRRPVTKGLNLEKIGVEVDNRGRIVIDSEFNTSAKGVKCIGDVTFGPMLAHKAEEEGIAAVEYIHSGYGHVAYNAIPSVVYTHPGEQPLANRPFGTLN